jgi:hypothetical protein
MRLWSAEIASGRMSVPEAQPQLLIDFALENPES